MNVIILGLTLFWKKLSPVCLPCQSAVWIQNKDYYIKYPWWDFADKNVDTGWIPDWDETDYEGSAQIWTAYMSGNNWNSTMHDEPFVGWKALEVNFQAISMVKCLTGKDKGQIYATVRWGYWDLLLAGGGEWDGGGIEN
jgi:hypothetical protein